MDLSNQLKSEEAQNLDLPETKSKDIKSLPKPTKGKVTSTPIPESDHEKAKINFGTVFNWIIFFLVLFCLIYVGYILYKTFMYQPQTNIEEVKLIDDQEVIRRIDGSVHEGKEISPSESGYGRSDPFKRY